MSRKIAAKVVNVFASILEESLETKDHKDLDGSPGLDGKRQPTSQESGIKDSTEGPRKIGMGLKEDGPEKTEPMETDSGNTDTMEKGHAADMPSELLSNKIAIQTHICKGTLQQAPRKGNGRWQLRA
ncbi:heterokaryon incompatibility protein [Colletotrichum tofieldiae]|nr:heterokaryon incompatibility protein [Colletotrichum tofieldiae]